ncbi:MULTISPECIES: hypothetical protein [unclassified Flavobacterium]|uniref:hypothetical protein n=1 Tax=unclassified Flavobacterium TaxID=196869 RepID=UPI00129195F6|nr:MULTISPECIES: hypothetical protein [unclassified Flavobacterium]MQP52497.1 hypothetical protein [Flavobacterium sp. LMO9]MQP62567.1 hypothetical protein [Flavobacterium sp. LMO6]
MKKITLLIAFIGMITLQSCTVNEVQDNVDNDTIAEVFELRNVNFSYNNSTGGYFIYRSLNPQIYASDNVLIYRMSDLIDSNTPVWQLIPRTLYLNEGELDYDFDFSREDFTIYADGTYNLSVTPEYIFNQTFRIVIIPGYFSNRSATQVDFNDYNAVIEAYGINPASIKRI